MRRENRPKLTFTVHLVSLSYIYPKLNTFWIQKIMKLVISFFFALAIITLYKYLKTKLHCYLIQFYCNCILRPFLPSDRSSKCKRGAVLMWRSRSNLWYYDFNISEQVHHWCPVQALPSIVADASWRTLLSKRRLSIPPPPL